MRREERCTRAGTTISIDGDDRDRRSEGVGRQTARRGAGSVITLHSPPIHSVVSSCRNAAGVVDVIFERKIAFVGEAGATVPDCACPGCLSS